MQKVPISGLLSFIRARRGFLLGFLAGAMVAGAATSLADDGEKQRDFAKSVLYAVTGLAVDTETNATNIVALRDRIDDLELRVDGLLEDKN